LAHTFERINKYDEMLEFLFKYIKRKPRFFAPYVFLAVHFFNKNEIETAKKFLIEGFLKTSIYSYSDFALDLRSRPLKINHRMLVDKLKKAAPTIMNPEFIDTAKAILLFQENPNQLRDPNIAESSKILKKVIIKDPNIIYAYLSLANINLKKRNLKRTQDLLKKAARIDINNPLLMLLEGKLNNLQGNFKAAKENLNKASQFEWQTFMAKYEQGISELGLGNNSEALSIFDSISNEGKYFQPYILKISKLEET